MGFNRPTSSTEQKSSGRVGIISQVLRYPAIFWLSIIFYDWFIQTPDDFLTSQYIARILFIGLLGGFIIGLGEFYKTRHNRHQNLPHA